MNFQFILALLAIAAEYLKNVSNKAVAKVGADIEAIDAATMAVLALNARIKGLSIDWKDPAAVQEFVASLPEFVPIPAPSGPKPAKT